MTNLLGKELLIQFTVRCFVNFCQILRAIFCFEGGLWGLIVLIPDPDHCLSLYFD